MCFKMNAREFGVFAGRTDLTDVELESSVLFEARAMGHPLVVTLAEQGMVGATPEGVAVIEWAERWPELQSPGTTIRRRLVTLETLGESERRISYEDFGV